MKVAILIVLYSISICCGDPVQLAKHTKKPSVVGGTTASITKYPFVVNLLTILQGHYQICGASIISPRHVITAAHCTHSDALNISISVGSAIIQQGTRYYTTDSKAHPLFNMTTGDYDIGIIITRSDIKLNGVTSKAVNLVNEGVKQEPGDNIIVLGWGSRLSGGFGTTAALREVTVQIVNQQVCAKLYSDVNLGVSLTPRMFCAGDLQKGGKDSCDGDSGGPAVTPAGVLVGIVSSGYECGHPYAPGTYTDISSLRAWVRSVTGF